MLQPEADCPYTVYGAHGLQRLCYDDGKTCNPTMALTPGTAELLMKSMHEVHDCRVSSVPGSLSKGRSPCDGGLRDSCTNA